MSPDSIAAIRTDFALLAGDPEGLAAEFYGRLFALEPEFRSLFRSDMVEQGRKLVAMLGVVVRSLDRLDTILPAVEALGRRHVGYGVKASDYAIVGQALLGTLENRLPAFDRSQADWTEAYGLLSRVMITAAEPTLAA